MGIKQGAQDCFNLKPSTNLIVIPEREQIASKSRFPVLKLDWELFLFPKGNATMTDLMSNMGDFVRSRRKAAKMTQQELGELAGVGTRFISDFERGKPTVRLAEVDAVLAVFGKSIGIVDRPRGEEKSDDQ